MQIFARHHGQGHDILSDTQNHAAVLSRTGFVISYAGCPIYWASKLQTEIALSTTEAEYMALSIHGYA